jgi:hypothetical protein
MVFIKNHPSELSLWDLKSPQNSFLPDTLYLSTFIDFLHPSESESVLNQKPIKGTDQKTGMTWFQDPPNHQNTPKSILWFCYKGPIQNDVIDFPWFCQNTIFTIFDDFWQSSKSRHRDFSKHRLKPVPGFKLHVVKSRNLLFFNTCYCYVFDVVFWHFWGQKLTKHVNMQNSEQKSGRRRFLTM